MKRRSDRLSCTENGWQCYLIWNYLRKQGHCSTLFRKPRISTRRTWPRFNILHYLLEDLMNNCQLQKKLNFLALSRESNYLVLVNCDSATTTNSNWTLYKQNIHVIVLIFYTTHVTIIYFSLRRDKFAIKLILNRKQKQKKKINKIDNKACMCAFYYLKVEQDD